MSKNRDPFKNLKDKVFELEIGNDVVKINPKVKDAEIFVSLGKGDMSDQALSKISGIIIESVLRANPDVDRADIEIHVATNYGKYIDELTVLYGFATRDQLSEAKKKLQDKTE